MSSENDTLNRERYETLEQLEEWLEVPVLVLGFFWLLLLIVELIWGLNPFLEAVTYLIWGIFVLDFGVRFILAPHKLPFLRTNWLTVLSLFLPALRVFAIFRVVRVARALQLARATRGLRLVKLVGSLNRGMRALRASMGRRGFGYVVLLTLVVVLVGAAGMFAFENDPAGGQGVFAHYGEALWWTAMLMTTLGSEKWPQTGEGRLLTLLISLYAFAVFGYLTAALASFFLGRDANSQPGEAVAQQDLQALREEIRRLSDEVRALRGDLPE